MEKKEYFFCVSQYNQIEKKLEWKLSQVNIIEDRIEILSFDNKQKIELGNNQLIYRGREIHLLKEIIDGITEENVIDFNLLH